MVIYLDDKKKVSGYFNSKLINYCDFQKIEKSFKNYCWDPLCLQVHSLLNHYKITLLRKSSNNNAEYQIHSWQLSTVILPLASMIFGVGVLLSWLKKEFL